MKKLAITLFICLPVLALYAAGNSNGIEGEISDSQCALNVHSLNRSHAEMIAKQTLGTDAASCARACVRRGGEWVLRSGEKVYRLKNQAGVERFSGKKVKVFGLLDSKTETIDNDIIEGLGNR
jgi:hypothetical protein